MLSGEKFQAYEDKMKEEGLSDAAILSFKNSFLSLLSGETGMILESNIKPVHKLPTFEQDVLKSKHGPDATLLNETVVLKLNGGLGTSMGLDKAKSLLEVKDGQTFLDLIAQQIMKTRENYQTGVRFMLMNSFSTSKDTLKFLKKYPDLVNDPQLELMQNKVPKVNADTNDPIEWRNKKLEWCPPGHGDLYAALYGSGKLDELLQAGIKYMFVSNSDNLGATLDLKLLTWFAKSDMPFLMEVCERTAADKKGGHLAMRKHDHRLILRESAQCDKSDEAMFQDTEKHKFFNTNNLWIRLDSLKEELEKSGGIIHLPMIKNAKTVDPQDSESPAVFQLETAMGAAIECFEGAGALVVPRSRFAPVKKCNDLFLLRSDAYTLTENATLELDPSLNGVAPLVNLDSKEYKLVQQLQHATAKGVPSMLGCNTLNVKGKVKFAKGIEMKGVVTITNNEDDWADLDSGVYENSDLDVTGQKSSCEINCAIM